VDNSRRIFTREELGLIGPSGTSKDSPILAVSSFGKGPGPDNLPDVVLHRNPKYRDQIFEEVYDIFNGKKDLT